MARTVFAIRAIRVFAKFARLNGGPKVTDRKARLLAAGGIPCAIPGCDGVVGAAYVLDTDEGQTGMCGIAVAHTRLIATDAEARAVFDRLVRLRESQKDEWPSPSDDGADTFDELPN